MSSSIGNNIMVTIFGESHSAAVGMVMEGLPPGEKVDMDALRAFMKRRAPGRSELTTQRKEPDEPEILSGIKDGVTCGTPVCIMIRNLDTRPSDYDEIKNIPRPGHADYTSYVRYGGFNDYRGGG
ncbi:MAG: chorismate synthase, partial [Firmicutes bacterium]|nr:chorismate synthase [Bacillota bacterium]